MSDTAFETLWQHTLEHWEDAAAHRAFLEHCQERNLLVEAAVRYRGLKSDPGRGPLAQQKLKAIAALAMARLESARTPDRRTQSRFSSYLFIALFVLTTLGLLAYLNPDR